MPHHASVDRPFRACRPCAAPSVKTEALRRRQLRVSVRPWLRFGGLARLRKSKVEFRSRALRSGLYLSARAANSASFGWLPEPRPALESPASIRSQDARASRTPHALRTRARRSVPTIQASIYAKQKDKWTGLSAWWLGLADEIYLRGWNA